MLEILYRDSLKAFLQEDLGREGDVSSQALDLHGRTSAACIVAREAGTVAGLCFMEPLFRELHDRCIVESRMEEGANFEAGASLLLVSGPTEALLAGERTALNLLSRCCGMATQARHLVRLLEGTSCQLLGTRKTLPGLRFFDRYAIEIGGASRHRFGLDDAIVIKDNHRALGGGIGAILPRARSRGGPMLVIEIECDTLDQVREVLWADQGMLRDDPRCRGVDVVLLDNMTCSELAEAVQLIRAHCRPILSEASGGVRGEDLRAIARTGVDYVSMGSLTHTVIPIDLGLDFLPG